MKERYKVFYTSKTSLVILRTEPSSPLYYLFESRKIHQGVPILLIVSFCRKVRRINAENSTH